MEIQANRFASCLLMPRQEVYGQWRVGLGLNRPVTFDDIRGHSVARPPVYQGLRPLSDFVGGVLEDMAPGTSAKSKSPQDYLFNRTARLLAPHFHVSTQAMRYRLEDLGLLIGDSAERRSGATWMARCPAHRDTTPSLSISVGNNGKVLVCCHAGCGQRAVIEALTGRGLWDGRLNGSGHGVQARWRPIEGIETCLAAMQLMGKPAWAALSTSGLRSLVLPRSVRRVTVLADGDPPGEAAAQDCARRWQREGR